MKIAGPVATGNLGMQDANRHIGLDRRAASTGLTDGHPMPWPGESPGEASDRPPLPADDEPAGLDTMIDVRSGPARGIVLAFVPALLAWTGLIALAVKLLK